MTPPHPAAVRAACERLRPHLDDWRLYPYPMAPDDMRILAFAYLAAHPRADTRPAAGERVIVQHMNGFEVREHRLEKPGTIEGYYVGFARELTDADLLCHGRQRIAELEVRLKKFY